MLFPKLPSFGERHGYGEPVTEQDDAIIDYRQQGYREMIGRRRTCLCPEGQTWSIASVRHPRPRVCCPERPGGVAVANHAAPRDVNGHGLGPAPISGGYRHSTVCPARTSAEHVDAAARRTPRLAAAARRVRGLVCGPVVEWSCARAASGDGRGLAEMRAMGPSCGGRVGLGDVWRAGCARGNGRYRGVVAW